MSKKNSKIEEKVLAESTDVEVVDTVIDSDEILVNDPEILRPRELPLVVVLPESASKAQIEFAKVLNGYAYKNPTKWNIKKTKLIAQLRALKNAPDPVELGNGKLSYSSKLISL